MVDGAVKPGKPRGSLPPLALFTVAGGGILSRKIEFHTARRSFSGFGVSTGEILRPDEDPSGSSGAGPSSAGQGRGSDAGVVPCGLDPELRFEITCRRIGAGLANLGNTCFLSSVLQCLTYTEPLAAYLQSGKHKLSCRTAGFCAMCALQSHVVEALQATGKILRPFHLVKNLRCISRNFRSARQEDAHEYMINLLEAMHKSCLPAGVASESSSAYEKSLVHKIFGGLFRSQVKCTQCSYCSNKFDPFLDLSLEIVKADSLCKALSHFISEEQLDGGEKQYHCSQCNQKVRALKNMSIHKAPYVLTIHLKRFGSHASGQKIGKQVDFDPKLNLKPYVSDPLEEDLEYTLYGVLVHAGYGTHSGHYYCFVRTSGGMWFSLNDDQVCQVSEKMVLQQKAYMLFYVRNVGSIIKRENNPSHKGIKRLPTSEKVKGISVTEHFLKNDTVASEQESNGQHTTDAQKVNVKDGGNSRSKNCKIMSKGKGRKVSHLRNFSFRPWRFLLLSLSMRRKKRVGISQTLTGGGVRKIGIPKVNDDPEREGLVREPVDPIRPLKTDFREHSVPCWEDVEIQPESQVIDDEPRSIGYLLDEEEMEYDRGRRKKVKTQRDSFGGPNPFEELALARVQKKMRGRC